MNIRQIIPMLGIAGLLQAMPLTAIAQEPATNVETTADGKRLHTIQKGETLYSLTKRYGVTAKEICDANPGLSAENFKIGTVILIPLAKPSAVQVDEDDDDDDVQPVEGLAGSNCKEMHKVKRKETLFSIAQKYGISLSELQNANPETLKEGFQLKKKMILCIPYPKKVKETVPEAVPTNEELFRQSRPKSEGLQSIRMGVILPLKGKTSQSERMLDFYRGMLMAVDSLKQRGLSFEIYTFDAGTTAADLQKILDRPILPMLDILFGPTDPTQIKTVSQFASKHNSPMVIPFHSKSSEVGSNSRFFVLNAPDSVQNNESATLFKTLFSGCNLLLVETGLTTNSLIPRLRQDFTEVRFAQLPITESVLLSRLDKERQNVILLSTSDMKSFNIFMPTLRSVLTNHPELRVKLVGYADWLSYSSTSFLNDLYKADTYILSPFFLDTQSPFYKRMAGRFYQNFGSEMQSGTPRMAVYGYDCALYFLQGLALYGKNFSTQHVAARPLQNHFHMQRVSNWGGLVNRHMQMVHFSPNRTIELIEKNAK